MTDAVEQFIAARRAYLSLLRGERQLYARVQAKFPKSHPLFKSIFMICHNEAIRMIRYHCDEAICKCADSIGDDLFRDAIVDGVRIPAVTHFFYGLSCTVPEHKITCGRTKKLTMSDLQLFEQVYALGHRFVDAASSLPYISRTAIARESSRYEKAFEKVRSRVAEASTLYTGYVCLSDRLGPGVANHVIAFCDS